MTLQECQEDTTSTEFLEWQWALQIIDFQERSKQDYYSAQIVAEIRRFREGFSRSPAAITVEECLMDFGNNKFVTREYVTPDGNVPLEPGQVPRNAIEIGPDAVKDPKWADVNKRARALLAMQLGHPGDPWTELESNA